MRHIILRVARGEEDSVFPLSPGGFGARFAMRDATCTAPGARFLELHGGAQECQPKAVRRLGPRRKLRLEQRGDKETMIGQLHGASLTLNAAGAYAKTGGLELLFVFFVDAVIAVILLRIVFASANGMEASAGKNFQAFLPGGLGTTLAAIRQAAGKRRDHIVRRAGIILRAVRVGNLQNISRIL